MQCLCNSFNTTKLRLFLLIKKDGTKQNDYDTKFIILMLLREKFHNIMKGFENITKKPSEGLEPSEGCMFY
jgi:hypothetical protein